MRPALSLTELTLATLAELAYEDPQDVARDPIVQQFEKFVPLQESYSEAFVVMRRKTLVIAFRGTEIGCGIDLISDIAMLFPRHRGAGRIHRGFNQYVDRLRNGLLDVISELKPDRIVCTGHSLGGAAATIFASDCVDSRIGKQVYLFTIGSPRVGTKPWANELERLLSGRQWRFVLGADVVPQSPPAFRSCFLPNYRHVGPPIMIDPTGKTILDPGLAMTAFLRLSRLAQDCHASTKDHSAKEYCRAIRNRVEFCIDNGLATTINIEIS